MPNTETNRVNVNLSPELSAWVSYAAGLYDKSKTAFIADCIAENMERAAPKVKEAFKAFREAREDA